MINAEKARALTKQADLFSQSVNRELGYFDKAIQKAAKDGCSSLGEMTLTNHQILEAVSGELMSKGFNAYIDKTKSTITISWELT